MSMNIQSAKNYLNWSAKKLQGDCEVGVKRYQTVMKKTDFIFRNGSRGYSKMSQKPRDTDKDKLADKQERRDQPNIEKERKYVSQTRILSNHKLYQRQTSNDKIKAYPKDTECKRDGPNETQNRQHLKNEDYMYNKNKNTCSNSLKRQRNEETQATFTTHGVYRQNEKKYKPCSHEGVVTAERAQQRQLAAEKRRTTAQQTEIAPVFPDDFQFSVYYPFGVREAMRVLTGQWEFQDREGWTIRNYRGGSYLAYEEKTDLSSNKQKGSYSLGF